MILVTGGAGFIGSNFVDHLITHTDDNIVILDKLTYAGHKENLSHLPADRYQLVEGKIEDRSLVKRLLSTHQPKAIVHFAAESHVDRSIADPTPFIETNIIGTFSLLEETRSYWNSLSTDKKAQFRFLHVSTDEVYGSLSLEESPFTEESQYRPNSPYSASKAASDHLVRSYYHTYKLPTIISNCSNNYGPRQYPEKLIPLTIFNALKGKPLPLYGEGINERNWLYVDDHCSALLLQLQRGVPGEVYLVGAECSRSNRDVVHTICRVLDSLCSDSPHIPHSNLITQVKDRPGHDLRYDIDSTKIEKELDWKAAVSFEKGIQQTIEWYLSNKKWLKAVSESEYKQKKSLLTNSKKEIPCAKASS
jgi:dTDP-glucose 4,6-dehydratase